MIYIKVLDRDGNLRRVEALEDPFFVRHENGVLTRCREAVAEGLLLDSDLVVNYGSGLGAELTAEQIPVAEYDTLQVDPPDPEDDDPEIPDGSGEAEQPMTRAELTEKVNQLEEQLEAAKILLGVSE